MAQIIEKSIELNNNQGWYALRPTKAPNAVATFVYWSLPKWNTENRLKHHCNGGICQVLVFKNNKHEYYLNGVTNTASTIEGLVKTLDMEGTTHHPYMEGTTLHPYIAPQKPTSGADSVATAARVLNQPNAEKIKNLSSVRMVESDEPLYAGGIDARIGFSTGDPDDGVAKPDPPRNETPIGHTGANSRRVVRQVKPPDSSVLNASIQRAENQVPRVGWATNHAREHNKGGDDRVPQWRQNQLDQKQKKHNAELEGFKNAASTKYYKREIAKQKAKNNATKAAEGLFPDETLSYLSE